MKADQPQGIKVFLLFSLSLIPLLQSIPSFTAQIDVETKTDPMPLGPPPERYQEWSDLQELFDNAVVDETWTTKEFEQAVVNGGAYRENCIDAHGILHLIEVEDADLTNLAKLLTMHLAILEGFRFKNASVDNYSLGKLTHNILFRFCSFKEANFEKPEVGCMSFKMGYMSFENCDLRKTKFSNTSNLSFSGCLMQETSFRDYNQIREFAHCNLRKTTFAGSLTQFNCRECDLYNSSFEWSALLWKTNFGGCDLSNSSFEKSTFHDQTDFESCDLSNSSFERSSLYNARFNGCDLSNSSFDGSLFGAESSFNGCDLSNSSFEGSMFCYQYRGGNFNGCNLSNVSFDRSTFRYSLGLIGCLFNKTIFKHVRITDIYVTRNIPYDADFADAHIVGEPVLENCTVRLAGLRHFSPDFDPFPGAFIANPVQLYNCQDPSGHPIPDCSIIRTPDFQTVRPRNQPSTDRYYFEKEHSADQSS